MNKQSLTEIIETIDHLEELYASYEYCDSGFTTFEQIKSKEEYLNKLLNNGAKYGYINDIGSPYGFGTGGCN